MVRRAAVIILALALNPALLRAQDTVLTVNVPSADVYKGPSNVTPVIGHASRGAVLPVLRNLGSWIKVEWPDAQDGIGYVHVTMVTMGRVGPAGAAAPAAIASPRPQAAPPLVVHAPPRVQGNVAPASHIVGVGGMVGSTSGIGATARAWRNNRVGVQFGLTRDDVIQFEPGVVYALFDRVSDYVWIRPYVGSAMIFRRETPDNGVGFRIFGGSELTFASVPQLGLSADLGYRRLTPQSPLSASIAVHWYIK